MKSLPTRLRAPRLGRALAVVGIAGALTLGTVMPASAATLVTPGTSGASADAVNTHPGQSTNFSTTGGKSVNGNSSPAASALNLPGFISGIGIQESDADADGDWACAGLAGPGASVTDASCVQDGSPTSLEFGTAKMPFPTVSEISDALASIDESQYVAQGLDRATVINQIASQLDSVSDAALSLEFQSVWAACAIDSSSSTTSVRLSGARVVVMTGNGDRITLGNLPSNPAPATTASFSGSLVEDAAANHVADIVMSTMGSVAGVNGALSQLMDAVEAKSGGSWLSTTARVAGAVSNGSVSVTALRVGTGPGFESAGGASTQLQIGSVTCEPRVAAVYQDEPDPVLVIPSVDFVDPSCPTNIASFSGGNTDLGITYTVASGSAAPGESIVVKAEAPTGSEFPGGTTTRLFNYIYPPAADCGTPPVVITPNVTFQDPACTNLNYLGYSYPADLEGVTYSVVSGITEPGETIVIRAEAPSGATFPGGDTVKLFTHTFATIENCDDDPDMDVVVNVNLTWEDPTCLNDNVASYDFVAEGVTITTTGEAAPGKTLAITATINDPAYSFQDGTTTKTWSHTFPDAVENCGNSDGGGTTGENATCYLPWNKAKKDEATEVILSFGALKKMSAAALKAKYDFTELADVPAAKRAKLSNAKVKELWEKREKRANSEGWAHTVISQFTKNGKKYDQKGIACQKPAPPTKDKCDLKTQDGTCDIPRTGNEKSTTDYLMLGALGATAIWGAVLSLWLITRGIRTSRDANTE